VVNVSKKHGDVNRENSDLPKDFGRAELLQKRTISVSFGEKTW
jgi:hypothetical protein